MTYDHGNRCENLSMTFSSGIRDDDDFVDDDRTEIQCTAQARPEKLRRLISVVDNDKQSRITSSCNHKLWQVQIYCF